MALRNRELHARNDDDDEKDRIKMAECDDVLLSLVCDISDNFYVPGQAGPFLGLTYSAVGKARHWQWNQMKSCNTGTSSSS